MMDNERSTGRVVVGVDGSPASILALQEAGRMAEALDKQIDVITAWQYPSYLGPGIAGDNRPDNDAEEYLTDALTSAFGSNPPEGMRRMVTQGLPARMLVDASHDADMLVVGSRGHGGFVGLMLGSVSSRCAEHAYCPVLVVHSRDHY